MPEEEFYYDDGYNRSWPFYHYEDIQSASNNTHHKADSDVANFMPAAMQKNLSTTATPFLPSEQEYPKEWPGMVGIVFAAAALGLIVMTVVRHIRQKTKRKHYEEIQSLIV